MDKLKIFWPHPKVEFKGRGISEAWLEVMESEGFTGVQAPEEADMAFFISDSQLKEEYLETVIGKIPTIGYVWGWPPERAFHTKYMEDKRKQLVLLKQCTRILTPGFNTYYQLCDYGIMSNICLPGVDSRTLDRCDPGPLEKKEQVCFLSRLAPEKGLDTLIVAMSLFNPRVPLVIMGPGDKTRYEGIANDLRVPVEFIEPTDEEKVRVIRESLVLIHPSNHEGFSLPPLEALYLETPVIVSDIPQHRWLLQEHAYYFSTPEQLAEMIQYVGQHFNDAIQVAKRGRERIRAGLTLERAGADLWAHLHQTHKQFWASVLRTNPHDRTLVQRCYEEVHKQNWAYGMTKFDSNAPLRFNPEWSRHWRAQYFIEALKDCGAKDVLDIGAGAVYPVIFARAGFAVTGFDVSEEALTQALALAEQWGVKRKVKVKQGYAQSLPYDDNSWSGVVLGEILEHVPDPDVVLAEAMRVVRSGGRVIISTPYGANHYDPFHIASAKGGWDDEGMTKLLAPWTGCIVKEEKIAEEGTTPSCYFVVLEKR